MPDTENKNENNGISTTVDPGTGFQGACEGEKNWAIRMGGVPVDFGDKGGIERIANADYFEIGQINDEGDFVPQKRIHALGLNEEWKMEGDMKLVGFVVDGKLTKFQDDPSTEKDIFDLIQRDSPHETLENQLDMADSEKYTKIVFQGSEREVLQLYGAMLKANIKINNQDKDFSVALPVRNGNSYNAEMNEKLHQMAKSLGIEDRLEDFDPKGWDIGHNENKLTTETATSLKEWDSISDLKGWVEELEKTSHEQLLERKADINVDLETEIPAPSGR